MSTAYFSRIRNTVVSGNELRSYLTGADIRDLEFEAATRSAPALNVTTSNSTAALGATLTADQWVQAAISSLVVNPSSTANSLYINVGASVNSQALAYIDLFNLKSTNDVRILNFVPSYPSISGADVNLATGDGGATFVTVSSSALGAGIAASPLLDNKLGSCMLPRVVLVSATNLTAGSQSVNFNIVPTL